MDADARTDAHLHDGGQDQRLPRSSHTMDDAQLPVEASDDILLTFRECDSPLLLQLLQLVQAMLSLVQDIWPEYGLWDTM